MNPKSLAEEQKKRAALEAVKQVESNFIVGLGSGSTAAYAIAELGDRIKRERLSILGVPTSSQTFMLAVEHGIPMTTLIEHPVIDVSIDGADQIDDELNLIKGMGGALTREKIVAVCSRKRITIADQSKKVKMLGEDHHPVPVEVVPFAASLVVNKLKEMNGRPVVREGAKKLGPVVTDNGNMLIDTVFGLIEKPMELERKLKELTGVVETGLFIKLTDVVYLGTDSTVRIMKK